MTRCPFLERIEVGFPTDSEAKGEKKKAAASKKNCSIDESSFFKYSPEANDASASAMSAMRAATFMLSEEGGEV